MFIAWEDPKTPRLFLKVTKAELISAIKAKIAMRLHVPPAYLTLVYYNMILLDHQRLDKCRVKQSATVTCLVNMKDKPGTRLPTMTEELDDVVGDLPSLGYVSDDGNQDSSRDLTKSCDISTSDIPQSLPDSESPDYRHLYPGASFLALCSTSICPAYTDTVYISKGFSVFRLSSLSYYCPKCRMPATPTGQLCFYKAKWKFVGVTEDGVRLTEEGCTEGNSRSLVECPDGSTWLALKLIVHSVM